MSCASFSKIDIEAEGKQLKEELITVTSEARRQKHVKLLKLINALKESGVNPEWVIMSLIPLIPPELRPLVPLDGGGVLQNQI